ncbi:MAG: glucans biosynthesis glucosyltransferase MdoH [Pseudomonadota bacterium]
MHVRSGAPGGEWWSAKPIDEAPLAMPQQALFKASELSEARRNRRARQNLTARAISIAVFALTIACSYGFAIGLWDALSLDNGGSVLHYLFLGISVATFGWIAFGAANAIVGAGALLIGRGQDTIKAPPVGTPLRARTALLYPVYHEDPQEIADGIRTLVTGLGRLEVTDKFDVFVLSDSRTDDARANEKAVFAALEADVPAQTTVVYRNRSENAGKKAGNVADWVRTFGGAYPHFIVFDVDSEMSPETVLRLALALQAHPGTGLIQTVPRLIGARTWFARLQQFANNLFAPVSAAGFAAWQDSSGNYWGHNAIIRTRAFASAAGLPELRGPKPFGGPIQSHDFVEAAFLRRAGWRVALITSLTGSYEGSPPNLFEIAVRDRRWMQGNLQHVAVVPSRGLAPISRLHLAVGIFAYISSALWALMIATGLWLIWREDRREVSYFSDDKTLFPNWPVFDPQLGLWLLSVTLLAVFMPKILGLGVELWRNTQRRVTWLQAGRLIGGWCFELVFSALMAPTLMLMQLRSLVQILTGQDSGWNPQNRKGSVITLGEALRYHAVHVVTGIAIGIFCVSHSWYAFAWISPVVLGLLLSPLLTAWSSQEPDAAGDLLATQS